MCGITGIINLNSDLSINPEYISKMTNAIFHRGPDFGDLYKSDKIHFGHRRLSIIDLSSNANQPIFSDDKKFVMVYNGEIYNYKEFIPELISDGVKLKSDSDTEVLLYLLIKYKEKILDKLVGMFALAFLNRETNEVLLIRDRTGVKPLYYTIQNGFFYFSSEIKSFFAINLQKEIDEKNFNEWVLFRYITGENTIFKNIFKILPGYLMKISGNGEIKTYQWWNLINKVKEKKKIEKPYEWFKETFYKSLKYRMVSDVPVGILLSGGLDSSCISQGLHDLNYNNIDTFNVSFKDVDLNESHLAKGLSDKLNFKFHSLFVEDDLLNKNIELSCFANDEPLIHQNDVQLTAISFYAKNYVKVLLSGEGSDEVLGGYFRYNTLKHLKLLKLFSPVLNLFTKNSNNIRFKKLTDYLKLKKDFDFINFNSNNISKDDFAKLGLNEFDYNTEFRKKIFNEAKSLYPVNILRQMLYFDQHTYLYTLNERNDKSTMIASIECREPFLYCEILEGSAVLPDKYLFKGKKNKHILLNTIGKKLPKEIRNFKKLGFAVNWYRYILNDKYLFERWNNLEKSEIFKIGVLKKLDVKKLIKLSDENKLYRIYLIQLFFLDYWYENYFLNFNNLLNKYTPTEVKYPSQI
ncbi:MAG: asparagine synthase (glutamine-hydrolyzing) [Ignavibacteria bacterium]|nr:asparagine synthase (glutamine-hydrolyzing) [Ignavibacteria bacterium]